MWQNLQEQSGFSDPGITPHKDHRPGDDPTSQDAVELGDIREQTVLIAGFNLLKR